MSRPPRGEVPFGARLRALREAAGLNKSGLARRSGVPIQSISKIEDDRQEPGWYSVLKLARGLGVSVAAFEVADPPADSSAGPVDPPHTPADQPEASEVPEVATGQPRLPRTKYK